MSTFYVNLKSVKFLFFFYFYSFFLDIADKACFYATAKGVVAQATVTSKPRHKKHPKVRHPEKYRWIIHAERAAISGCAKSGISTLGKGLYMHWFPCDECTKSIITAGIIILVCDRPDLKDIELQNKWHFKESLQMLIEAGIKIKYR